VKVGDLVYWHEGAWLMSQGIEPKIVHAIIVSKLNESKDVAIWRVIRCDNGQKGTVHESDLNVRVTSENR
jgi:hypothetical protein